MPDHIFVYPAYLDRAGPRRLGRRVPATGAVEAVTSDRILAAARSLGYTAELEDQKQYPRQVPAYAGRVKVTKKAGTTKSALLREIAGALARAPPPETT